MNKKVYVILVITLIIFLSIGSTIIYLKVNTNASNNTQTKPENLTVVIDGKENENINLFPTKCTNEYAIKKTIKASTSNTSGGKVSFSIGMNITTLSNELKRDTVRYVLSTSSANCNIDIIASGTFKDKNVGDYVWLIKNDYDNITRLDNTYTKIYYLYIWLDESETENITNNNISINTKVFSSNNSNLITETNVLLGYQGTLYYNIKSSADITTTINFSQTSETSNTNGIYMTKNTDSGIPVYYYRGIVDNHIIFANFCWRIIRTTETGGIKLIYDGVPNDGQCNNKGEDTTIGISSFNIEHNSPAYSGYMYGIKYVYSNKNMSSLSGKIIFGNDVIYNTTTNKYTLKETYSFDIPSNWSKEYSTITSKYHYTCFTSNNTCEKVNYIYFTNNSSIYYFELSNGKKQLDILKEMLNNSTNENDSVIKTIIDTWFQNNMINYMSQLEDTIFCNDRTYDVRKSGWNKDYSNINNYLYFNSYRRLWEDRQPTLICTSDNDKFTVEINNGNGLLTYPVGLITADEVAYAGGVCGFPNSSFYLYTGINTWTMSPSSFYSTYAVGLHIGFTGGLFNANINDSYWIRPSVSIKPGIIVTGGLGTVESPYVIS